MKIMLLTIALVVAGLLHEGSYAAGYTSSGTINAINLARGEVSINNRQYRLSSTVQVRLPSGSSASLGILQHERNVRFNTQADSATGQTYVTEIQIVQAN